MHITNGDPYPLQDHGIRPIRNQVIPRCLTVHTFKCSNQLMRKISIYKPLKGSFLQFGIINEIQGLRDLMLDQSIFQGVKFVPSISLRLTTKSASMG